MRKNLLKVSILFLLVALCSFSFRSLTINRNAQKITIGHAQLNRVNIINVDTVPIYVKFYDFEPGAIVPVPTYTDVPVLTFKCAPGEQIWTSAINSPSDQLINDFKYGIYARCVIGAHDTSNISPSKTPIVELNY